MAEFATKTYAESAPGDQHLAGLLDETLSRFADPAGAHWAFLHVARSQGTASAHRVPVGQEAISEVVPYEWGSKWRGVWMVMRRGRYLYGLTLFKSAPDKAAAFTLANLVDRRIRHGG